MTVLQWYVTMVLYCLAIGCTVFLVIAIGLFVFFRKVTGHWPGERFYSEATTLLRMREE